MKNASTSLPKVTLRRAQLADLPDIVKVHNSIIQEGGLTADLSQYTIDEKRAWFEVVSANPYVIEILEVENEAAGFVYVSPWRSGRAALKNVAEISYFLAKPFRGNGYGRNLLQKGIRLACENGIKNLLAILLDSNMPSIRLLESEGFREAGHLPQVAELKESVAGQVIMMKRITP